MFENIFTYHIKLKVKKGNPSKDFFGIASR